MASIPATCVWSVALLSILAGCADGPTSMVHEGEMPVAFRTVLAGTGPWHDSQQQVVADARIWREFWQAAGAAGPVPEVDFTTDRVVWATIGDGNGCYAVSVDEVTLARDFLRVKVTETRPGAGCACAELLQAPLHAVVVRGVAGIRDIRFEVDRKTLNCH